MGIDYAAEECQAFIDDIVSKTNARAEKAERELAKLLEWAARYAISGGYYYGDNVYGFTARCERDPRGYVYAPSREAAIRLAAGLEN